MLLDCKIKYAAKCSLWITGLTVCKGIYSNFLFNMHCQQNIIHFQLCVLYEFSSANLKNAKEIYYSKGYV